MKLFKILAVILLLALIGGGTYLYFNYANIAKTQAEKIASKALNVKVSIASLNISLSEKSVSVSGISIANPAGYKKSKAVEIGSVSIALAEIPKNLDLIKFQSFEVIDTVVNLEVTPNGANLIDLKNGMSKSSAPTEKSSDKASTKPQPKVTLEKFYVSQSTLNPSVTLIDRDLNAVKIPSMTLTGIGTKQNGVLAQDAIKQIMSQYLNTATAAANNAGYLQGLPDIEALKTQAKDKVTSEIKDQVNDTIGGELGEELGNEISDKVLNIFGN